MNDLKIPAMIYSRVSGYYNPVNNFNKGKKAEFEERQDLKIPDKILYRASTMNFNQNQTEDLK